LRDLKFW